MLNAILCAPNKGWPLRAWRLCVAFQQPAMPSISVGRMAEKNSIAAAKMWQFLLSYFLSAPLRTWRLCVAFHQSILQPILGDTGIQSQTAALLHKKRCSVQQYSAAVSITAL